jgi:spermidine synthase
VTADPDGTRPVTLARAQDEHGEVALRRRGAVLELVVDGVFAMDTVDASTEAELAALALDRLPTSTQRIAVLVGGLGLGFTTRHVLADPRVGRVVVAELHAVLVEWVRAGAVPPAAGLLDDPRVEVVVGDVRDTVEAAPRAAFDAVLLDVDNGPGFLVHARNAAVYAAPFLATVASRLRPGGVLAVWSADPAPTLRDVLADVVGPCEEVLRSLTRDGRALTYATYVAVRPPGGASDAPA